MMSEVWRAVVGFEGCYEVSSEGQVRSLPGNWRHGKVLRPSVRGPSKYLTVQLGARNYRYVHVLVLEAFAGPRPEGFVACHNNGRNLENRFINLRWDTPKENTADIRRHGRMYCGERQRIAKLTSGDVDRIRDQARAGVMQKEIASRFQVSKATICRVTNGKGWRHLPIGWS